MNLDKISYQDLKKIADHLNINVPGNISKENLKKVIEEMNPFRDIADDDFNDLVTENNIKCEKDSDRQELETLMILDEIKKTETPSPSQDAAEEKKVFLLFKNKGTVNKFGKVWKGYKKDYVTEKQGSVLLAKFPNKFKRLKDK